MHEHGGGSAESLFLIPAVVFVVAYVRAAASSRSGHWPWYRSMFFIAGVLTALATVLQPLANALHDSFAILSVAHLMAGMAAPLLLVLSRPFTLALRTLAVFPARRLSRLLRSLPLRFLAHPITAAVLNVGGMWLMFRTPLLAAMQESMPVHWLVTGHLVAAGYLWTAALISRDPLAHRASFPLRAVVLVLSVAAHNVLAKVIYADPPPGVPAAQAEAGALVMYYGGAVLELAVIIIFCSQWYRAARPRQRAAVRPRMA